jgi:lipopolysaccharide export system protein LptC
MAAGPGLHSRVVAVLKVGLPLVALGLLASLFLIQTEDRLGRNIVFSRGDVDALGSGLTISNPTFTGTTRGEDTFHFTAETVEPDAAPPQRARISALRGQVDFRNGPSVEVTAEAGDLDIPTQRLDLAGAVRIATSDGYRMRADSVALDLRAGTLAATGAVETTGPLGRIDSGDLHIAPAGADEARRFSFGKGVRLVYDPPESQ